MNVRGIVNYLFIFDVGAEIDIAGIERAVKLTKPVGLKYSRLMPKYVRLKTSPLLIAADAEGVRMQGIHQEAVSAAITVKAYEVGAVSVTIAVPLDGETLENLTKYSDPILVVDGLPLPMKEKALSTMKRVLETIRPHVANLRMSSEPEEYVTFCIEAAPLDGSADHLFAKILTGDAVASVISPMQISSTLRSKISYYANDAIFLDWSAALVVDPSGDFAAPLLVIELANLQLLEMRYYDRVLDELISNASVALAKRSLKTLFGGYGTVARNVAEQRVEIDSILETAKNYTKFIGEWYLARVYSGIADKLRLKDWDATLSGKLEILEGIYSLVSEQMSRRREILLEVVIVVLFVAEIIQQYIQWVLLH